MNDLQTISCLEADDVPGVSGHNLAIPFHCNAVNFQTSSHKKIKQVSSVACFNTLSIECDGHSRCLEYQSTPGWPSSLRLSRSRRRHPGYAL